MSDKTVEFSGSALAAPVCDLGEGPTYDPHTDTAFWFDIIGCKLVEHHLPSQTTSVHALPVMGSVLARVDDTRQVIASETGLHLRMVETGALELITPIEADNPVTRSNDGRIHQSGALWLGTMGKGAERGAGAIYHIARGVVTKLFSNITIPNAICFSPDGATAYFTDTALNKLMRVEIDPATGLPMGEPDMLYDNTADDGGLDGAVCDADGLIWNARWGKGCVDAYSPEGMRVKTFKLPTSNTTCPAFVGKDANRLLVTSALQGMSAEQQAAEPGAGLTYLLDLTLKGRPEPDYAL